MSTNNRTVCLSTLAVKEGGSENHSDHIARSIQSLGGGAVGHSRKVVRQNYDWVRATGIFEKEHRWENGAVLANRNWNHHRDLLSIRNDVQIIHIIVSDESQSFPVVNFHDEVGLVGVLNVVLIELAALEGSFDLT